MPPSPRLWMSGTLDHPSDAEIPAAPRGQLTAYRDGPGVEFPLGVAYMMITCRRQIHGLAGMAVHEHLAFAFDDWHPLFADMMRRLLETPGLDGAPAVVRRPAPADGSAVAGRSAHQQ